MAKNILEAGIMYTCTDSLWDISQYCSASYHSPRYSWTHLYCLKTAREDHFRDSNLSGKPLRKVNCKSQLTLRSLLWSFFFCPASLSVAVEKTSQARKSRIYNAHARAGTIALWDVQTLTDLPWKNAYIYFVWRKTAGDTKHSWSGIHWMIDWLIDWLE